MEVCESVEGLVPNCVAHDSPSSMSLHMCRYVQILAEETDDGICGPPSASSSSATVTMTKSSLHPSPNLPLTPTPSVSVASTSAPSDPPPVFPTPRPNETPTIGSVLVQPVQSRSGLTLFIIGILFLIIGVGVTVISALVLVQHRRACIANARRSVEEGKEHISPYPKATPTLNDDDTPVSQSSSLDSSDIHDAIRIGIVSIPQSKDEDDSQSNSPPQANGHCPQSIQQTDIATPSLGDVTPTEERDVQFPPGIITLDEDLTQSSCA